MLREAAKILPCLPEPGEASHVLMQGQFDLMVLLAAILNSHCGMVQHLRIATLSFNDRNTTEMVELLRENKVERFTLLCSEFFRDNNKAEFARASDEVKLFDGRWKLAAARNHAKVIAADGPYKLVIEGSANLRTNGNYEQIALIRDDALHDWHAGWIDEMVANAKEGKQKAASKVNRSRAGETG